MFIHLKCQYSNNQTSLITGTNYSNIECINYIVPANSIQCVFVYVYVQVCSLCVVSVIKKLSCVVLG